MVKQSFVMTRPKPAFGRQGLDWDRWARIQFSQVHFGAKLDSTDLLWCKNVTSPTGGSNRPFRCLEEGGRALPKFLAPFQNVSKKHFRPRISATAFLYFWNAFGFVSQILWICISRFVLFPFIITMTIITNRLIFRYRQTDKHFFGSDAGFFKKVLIFRNKQANTFSLLTRGSLSKCSFFVTDTQTNPFSLLTQGPD